MSGYFRATLTAWVAFSLLIVVDRFLWNAWPRQSFADKSNFLGSDACLGEGAVPGSSSCGNDRTTFAELQPGPCTYIFIYIYIHIHAYTSMYTCIYWYVFMCSMIDVRVSTNKHACVCVCVCMGGSLYICMYVHMYICYICTCIYIYAPMHLHISSALLHLFFMRLCNQCASNLPFYIISNQFMLSCENALFFTPFLPSVLIAFHSLIHVENSFFF
jgi:hypothetical protein